MTGFSKKVLSGQTTTPEDWNEYLIQMHKRAPGMTPFAFAPYKTKDGLNSYEILADVLEGYSGQILSVLDLACGDGHLIHHCLKRLADGGKIHGIDMSEGELEIARQNFLQKNIRFSCARSQSLPLGDASIDVIFCHMALMLMNPVEPVVAELSRVLKPGGVFAGVVGNPSKKDEFTSLASSSLASFQKKEFPHLSKKYPSGDPRARTQDGLRELFNQPAGFFGLESFSEFELKIVIEPEGIWDWYKDMYNVSLMPDESQLRWKTELVSLARERANPEGKLEFQFPMAKFVIRK